MQRRSPPKHRHDGTSPLPLGMDWSPCPRIWAGRETVWPHDPRTGWSYCVTIPSWILLAKSKDSDPVVFYRVLVGIQSPEGITTSRIVLRRFNDFLKLHAALKRTFPKKNIPPTPPKGLLRIKSRAMLEERRGSLEEWITKSLSDIVLSRSIVVASFLELEAAVRLSFKEDEKPGSSHVSMNSSDSSLHFPPQLSVPLGGSSMVASECDSDTAYETSEIGSASLERDNISEVGTEDLSFHDEIFSPVDKFIKYGVSNIDEGLSMGQAILEKLENFPKHKFRAKETYNDLDNGSSSKAYELPVDILEVQSELNGETNIHHIRKVSNESVESGSALSNLATSNSNGTAGDSDYKLADDVHLVFPMDQRVKMNRVLTTLQRRLITAKTDMEDLSSRLNQEIAVKDYLATKVKDLEVELETTRQKSKENLEQALFIERERMTQIQWEMEELRHKSIEMELKLNSQQMVDGQHKEDGLQQKLDSVTQKYENLLKQHQEQEGRSKADIKVLVKEVKSLRTSQADLKKQVSHLVEEKSEAEERLHEEIKKNQERQSSIMKLIYKCKILHEQLQEYNIKSFVDPPDFLWNSDDQIDNIIAEAQHLGEDDRMNGSHRESDDVVSGEQSSCVDGELLEVLKGILVDNGMLRKKVNSVIVHSVEMDKLVEKGETES